jgi:hypothetical protein
MLKQHISKTFKFHLLFFKRRHHDRSNKGQRYREGRAGMKRDI